MVDFQLFFKGLVNFLLDFRADIEILQLFVFSVWVDPVAQKYVYNILCRIGPTHRSCETGMAKT